MRLFYSTCPAGLEEVAARIAQKSVNGFSLKAKYSGAVLYSARTDSPECVAFNNTYLQIARVDKCTSVTHAAKLFLTDKRALSDVERAMRDYQFTTFRAMFSEANTLASVDKSYREAFERALRVANDRRTPDTELLVLRRSNGLGLLLLRLSKPASHADKGELSLSVAASVAFLAGLDATGTFIDPFAGGGSIAAARGRLGPCGKVYVNDLDDSKAVLLEKRLPAAKVLCMDAFELSEKFEKGAFDQIACDPPWGYYAPTGYSHPEFCRKMAEMIDHLLAPFGKAAVLTAMKGNFVQAMYAQGLDVTEKFDILVNGKKASVYVIIHKREEAEE